jgi:hypothetical protein
MAKISSGLVQLGWKVPENVREQFVSFCEMHGGKVQDEAAGALVVWQNLPSEIRDWAKLSSKGMVPADKEFWKIFQEGLRQAWRARLDTQHEKPDRKK